MSYKLVSLKHINLNPIRIVNVFSFLASQQKGKRENKLSELCASAVK